MAEIILSFFAVIGICALFLRLFDYLFYRNSICNFPLIVDFREATKEDAVDTFELLGSVSNRVCGKRLLECVVFIGEENGEVSREDIRHYIKVFDLPGKILTSEEFEIWKHTV